MVNVLHRYEATYNKSNTLKLEMNHEKHRQLKANIADAKRNLKARRPLKKTMKKH